MQNTILREFKDHPQVTLVTYNEGGRNNETPEWLKIFWSQQFLNSPVLYDETGATSQDLYGQQDTNLPFGRGFIIDQNGICHLPYFGYQPSRVIDEIYSLIGSNPDPTVSVWIPHLTSSSADWIDTLSVDHLGNEMTTYEIILFDGTGLVTYQETYDIRPLEYVVQAIKELW